MKVCIVFSILFAASVASAKPKLTSKTTGLYPSKTCKTKIKGEEGQDPVLTCPAGAKGFAVEVSFSATDTYVVISGKAGDTNISGRIGDKLEWRLSDGVPYALIVELADTDQNAEGSPTINSRVAVFGIGDKEARSQAPIVAKPKTQQAREKQRAWAEARALADKLAP